MKNTLKEALDIVGANVTDALSSVDHYEEGNVSIPTIETVEEAKKWVEENEK
jgi:hypothetical protein